MKKAKEPKLSPFLKIYSYCLLNIERLFIQYYYSFLLLALFCSLCWCGIFHYLLPAQKYVFLGLFATGFLISLWKAGPFKIVRLNDILYRLEKESAITNNALQHLYNPNFIENNLLTPTAKTLWNAHKERLLLTDLKIKRPKWQAKLKHPLHKILLLFALFSFPLSFSKDGGALKEIFFDSFVYDTPKNFYAFVSPPKYSKQADIYLTKTLDQQKAIYISPYSSLNIYFLSQQKIPVFLENSKGKIKKFIAQDVKKINHLQAYHLTIPIESFDKIHIKAKNFHKNWLFIVKDKIETSIKFTKKPYINEKGDLVINYCALDNFGFQKIYAKIYPLHTEKEKIGNLYLPKQLKLPLPFDKGQPQEFMQNFLQSPFSGQTILLKLYAQNLAGKIVETPVEKLFLPAFPFKNPLAAAIDEQRRILANHPQRKSYVLNLLQALQTYQNETVDDASAILVLQSAYTRLQLSKTEQQYRDWIDYMGAIAMHIEMQNINLKKNILQQIISLINKAIENNAPEKDIKQLITLLRFAIAEYMKEFAQNAEIAPEQPLSNNEEFFTEEQMQDLFKNLEDSAKKGDKKNAQDLLQKLSQLMQNLRIVPQKNLQAQPSQTKSQMDALAGLIEKQQDILNQTYQFQSQMAGEDINDKNIENKADQLATGQKKVTDNIKDLQDSLKKDNEKKDMPLLQALQEAKEKSQYAQKLLHEQNFNQAILAQKEVMQALHNAAQAFKEKMKNMSQEEGAQKKDPLGRNITKDNYKETSTKDSAKKRSLRILEEIRKKLEEKDLPPQQRRYLQKLLEQN